MVSIVNKKGIGLIEVIILVIVVSLISYVSYGTYVNYLVRSNEKLTQHQLINAMHDMEKYYSESGAYSSLDAKWPTVVTSRLVAYNNKYYAFSFYPSAIPVSSQSVCIKATPNSSTIQKNSQPLYIDHGGNITHTLPASCQPSQELQIPHERCYDVMYSTGKFASNYGNYPLCDDAHYPPSLYPNGCPVGVYYTCSAHCEGSIVLRDCSGYCKNVTVYCSFGACSGFDSSSCKRLNCGAEGC